MKILVTGSNGCVGNALKTIANDNNEWIFINRNNCDLKDRQATINLFENIKADYVVHLASYVPGFYNIDKVLSFSDNVKINDNVLEASHLSNINSGIFCLSVNMFAENPSKLPIDESMMFEGEPSRAVEGYAYSKRMLALQCRSYNEQHNRKYTCIIPCNVYGPNDNLNSGRLIPNLIIKFHDAMKNNSDVVINGTGMPLRQFIYSIDLAKIIKHLLFSYSSKPVICCGDTEISIAELSLKISSLINFNGKIEYDTTKKDGYLKKTVSNKYLKQIINNVEFTPLDDGLLQTINWLSDSKGKYG